MQQPNTKSAERKPCASSDWDALFMGFVIMLAIGLGPTVVGRAVLAAMVWWVYGGAGYASGIRVHFVGKTAWFTNGERVPNAIANASGIIFFVTSILLSYLIVYCVRHIYRLVQKRRDAHA